MAVDESYDPFCIFEKRNQSRTNGIYIEYLENLFD
jgi:hypothetical protein